MGFNDRSMRYDYGHLMGDVPLIDVSPWAVIKWFLLWRRCIDRLFCGPNSSILGWKLGNVRRFRWWCAVLGLWSG